MFWNYFFFARCCYFCCCCCRLCVPERLVLRHNEVIVLPLSQTFSGGWLLCCCVSIIFCFLSSAILCATDKSGGSRQPLRHNNVPSRSTDRHIHRRLHASYATCETHDYFYSTHTFTCHFHACNFVCYGGHTFCFFFFFCFRCFSLSHQFASCCLCRKRGSEGSREVSRRLLHLVACTRVRPLGGNFFVSVLLPTTVVIVVGGGGGCCWRSFGNNSEGGANEQEEYTVPRPYHKPESVAFPE